MLDSKIKKLMLGVAAAAAIAAPPAQAASTIKVAVDSVFANAANEIVAAFQYAYPTSGYTVVVTQSDSASLEADILAGAGYDLFLAGSKKQPTDLAVNYPSSVVGAPFKYAEDFLALYSTSVNINNGLPWALLGRKILAPDPTTDPYGAIAAKLLAGPPLFVFNIPGARAAVAPDAGTSLALLDNGAYPFGFVANSSICSLDANGQPSYDPAIYRHVYAEPTSAAHPRRSWHFLLSLFRGNEIDGSVYLTGVKLAKTRTADQETELNNFMAFLTGTVDVNGSVKTAGIELIQGHCFEIPATP